MSVTKTFFNKPILWEAESFEADYRASVLGGGWFDLSNWDTVQISGPDACDYLNRMSTVNFKTFALGSVAPGVFLTGKSIPIVWGFFFQPTEQVYLFIVPPGQGGLAYEHLEKFHFQEDLQLQDVSSDFATLAIWEPGGGTLEAPWNLGGAAGGVAKVSAGLGGWAWRDPFRTCLVWWFGKASEFAARTAAVEGAGLKRLGYRLFEFYRIEAGVVRVVPETTDKTLALQAGLDASISPQKGCYPGQEVVERIRTYGRVNSLCSRVEIEGIVPALPVDLVDPDGKVVGSLVAAEVLPEAPTRAYGIAYVNRAILDAETKPVLSASGGNATVQVKLRAAGPSLG